MVIAFTRPWAAGGASGASAPEPTRPPLHVRAWDGSRWRDGLDVPPAGPVFLFIHGLGEGGYVFEPVVPPLAAPGPCVVPDLAGHGDSGASPDGRTTIADHVADIDALCRRLGRRPLVLIGHSLGGAVALHLAARGHFDIRGLVLVDSGPEMETFALRLVLDMARDEDRVYADPADYRARVASARPLIGAATLDLYAARALRRRDDGQWVPKRDGRMLAGVEGEALVAAGGQGAAASLTMWSAIGALECPLLVMRGAASAALSQAVAQRMARRAADGELRLVPNAGHGVMADNPEGFVAALRPTLAAWS